MKCEQTNYYIYMTTNIVNNRKYIGKRMCHCPIEEDEYLGSGTALKLAIEKYGKENFVKTILEICEDNQECNKREIYWIEYFNACNNDEFYNIAAGGDGGNTYLGLNDNELSRISAIKSMKSSGKNNHMYGKHHSNETKEKIRIGQKLAYERKEKWGKQGLTGEKNTMSKKIYCIETGEEFIGIREAGRELDIPFPNIIRSLKSDGYYSAGKINGKRRHWKYCS